LPLFFFSKSIGLKQTNPSKAKKIIGLIIYSLLAVEGAIVGAGGGTVILLVMMYFFGYEIIRGYATNTPSELLSALVPAIIYSFYGFIEIWPAITIFLGMLIGGFVGAHAAIAKGNIWVKDLFTVVIILSVIKILFF
ncbi:MAG: sulfite exporter TauE/SafE family protein, partial [Candidatus Saccharimonadales bacterium]